MRQIYWCDAQIAQLEWAVDDVLLRLKISLLHLDLDVYKPTYYALINLYNKVSSCGLILIDDYNLVLGATKAVDHFIKEKKLKLKKLNLFRPTYLIKKK